jgi:hypothetical protein
MGSRVPLLALAGLCCWTISAAAQDLGGAGKQLARSTVVRKILVTGATELPLPAPDEHRATAPNAVPVRLADPIPPAVALPLDPPTRAPVPTDKGAIGFLKDDNGLQRMRLQPGRTRSAAPGADGHARKTAQIWNRYGGLLEVLAGRLAVQSDAAVAVIAAESGGQAFVNGHPVIRFENHHFWKHWGRNNPSTYARHFRFSTGEQPWTGHAFRAAVAAAWVPVHGQGQEREWSVYQFAEKLSRPDALRSASWGLAQILGSNHGRIGYGSVEAMTASFSDPGAGAHMQVLGLFDFVLGGKPSSRALTALRNRNWLVFAEEYNGKKNAEEYAKHLRLYYAGAQALIWN